MTDRRENRRSHHMIKETCEHLASKLNSITIPDTDGNPYLTRYFFYGEEKKYQNTFLHYFHASDKDRDDDGSLLFHNHPWGRAVSLILWGGYSEERRQFDGSIKRQTFLPGHINIIKRDTFHRVDLLDKGCWSLFLTGPRPKDQIGGSNWGFWNRNNKVYTDFAVMLKKLGKDVIIP
jgi:hypothetical protein